jgi:CubicO group peptidase (beta-lactamase class C family)
VSGLTRSAPLAAAFVLTGVQALLPVPARAQLPSPARDAAQAFVDVVRSGHEARLRSFIETRFAPELRDFVPLDEHVRMAAMLRADFAGLELDEVALDGPLRATLTYAGGGRRLQLEVRVEAAPPHRIEGVRARDAPPPLDTSIDDPDALLAQLAGEDAFSGVALVADGDELRLHAAYGHADRDARRPNLPDTRFDVGSVYKLFTSVAVLRLVQEGRLQLDDALGSYVDGFEPRVAERVTVRHLLAHRSGFGDYLDHPEFEAEPKRFRAPADFLPLAVAQGVAFEPGTRTRYSNMGFVLLGAILEPVTGRSWHDVVRELVFEPAGMTSAGPAQDAAAARRYHRMPAGYVAVDSLYPDLATPAGGGFAAVADLHRFVRALFAHELLDPGHTALLLNRFETPDPARLPAVAGFAGGADGLHAVVLVRPAERRAVILLANIEPIPADAIAQRLLELAGRHGGGS